MQLQNILECSRDDVPDIVDLMLARAVRTAPTPRNRIIDYFNKMYFDNPLYDAAHPSLICRDPKGRAIGFLGVCTRKMQMGQKPVTLAVSSNYCVHPGYDQPTSPLIPLMLLRRFMKGPQDISVADTATDSSKKIWEGAGGRVLPLYSLEWMRPLKPFEALLRIVETLGNREIRAAGMLRRLCQAGDILGRPILKRWANKSAGDFSLTELDPEFVLATLARQSVAIRPSYDAESFAWLMEMAEIKTGPNALRARQVADSDGRPIGWFMYNKRPNGFCDMIQLCGIKGCYGEVLSAAIADAQKQGGVLVRGTIRPDELTMYKSNKCFLYSGPWMLFHSEDADITDAFLSGRAMFTGLDGERLMAFENFYSFS